MISSLEIFHLDAELDDLQLPGHGDLQGLVVAVKVHFLGKSVDHSGSWF